MAIGLLIYALFMSYTWHCQIRRVQGAEVLELRYQLTKFPVCISPLTFMIARTETDTELSGDRCQGDSFPHYYSTFAPQNFHETAKKMSRFLGKDLTEAQLRNIEHETAFQQMKANPRTNRYDKHLAGIYDHTISPFLRCGRVNSSYNTFDETQLFKFPLHTLIQCVYITPVSW